MASSRKSVFTKGHLCLLAFQRLVFVIVYLMTTASVYCISASVMWTVVTAFIATRGTSQNRRILFGKIVIVVGMVGSLLLTFAVLTPRAYRITGRGRSETTWHHVIIGFGANPNWPFGNLADSYRGCWPGKPNDSLVPGLTDFNGGCVWADYAKRHGISDNQIGDELYDRNFNAGTRDGVFRIVGAYPLIRSFMTFNFLQAPDDIAYAWA